MPAPSRVTYRQRSRVNHTLSALSLPRFNFTSTMSGLADPSVIVELLQMIARIVACAQCGQRNRLSVTSTKKGIWKCRTCGGVLSEADAVAEQPKSRRGLIFGSGGLVAAAVMI